MPAPNTRESWRRMTSASVRGLSRNVDACRPVTPSSLQGVTIVTILRSTQCWTAAMTHETKAPSRGRTTFWLRVWLWVSAFLSVLGLASLTERFVSLTKFFHDILDVYRAAIREPLYLIGNTIWPFGHIPYWVFDVAVIWS